MAISPQTGNRDLFWVTGCPNCSVMRATMVAVGVSDCRGGFVSTSFFFNFLRGIQTKFIVLPGLNMV